MVWSPLYLSFGDIMERQFVVYRHVNKINGKIYVGLTNNVEKRWRADGKFYQGSPYFKHAIDKYGWDNFTHEILLENLTEKEAREKETEYILLYKSNDNRYGYNLTNGGDLNIPNEEIRRRISETKSKMTEEQKRHIKEAAQQREQMYREQGRKNPFYGRKHTKETKEKMSKANWYIKDPEKFMKMHRNHLNCGGAESRFAKKVVRLRDGKIYTTVMECAMDNNICNGTVENHCYKRLQSPEFMFFTEYSNLPSEVRQTLQDKLMDKFNNPTKYTSNNKRIIRLTDGKIFHSLKQCSIEEHLNPRTIYSHCYNKVRNPKYRYLEEEIYNE